MEQRDMEQRGGAVAESGTESRRTSSTTALLPDPEPRELRYTVISVDDHLVEPADMFVRHVPQRYKQRCPRVVDSPTGGQQWVYDGQVFEQLGLNAVVGHPRKEDWTFEPTRYEEMRPGCFDVDRRVADMDIDGVWASVCFPSMVTGFCGSVFSRTKDPDLRRVVRPSSTAVHSDGDHLAR
jgi:hypothetical protein